MAKPLNQVATVAMTSPGRQCAQRINGGVQNFSCAAFADGAPSQRTGLGIAVIVSQWPSCITGQTRLARRRRASPQVMMEAIGAASRTTYRSAMLFTVGLGREEDDVAHLNQLRAAGQTGEIRPSAYPNPVHSVPAEGKRK